jgi:hypothetical protein
LLNAVQTFPESALTNTPAFSVTANTFDPKIAKSFTCKLSVNPLFAGLYEVAKSVVTKTPLSVAT